MKHLIAIAAIVASTPSLAQISMPDSTAQVISYWNKGETQSYTVTTDKYKVNGADTTSHERITYDVDVTVLDSTQTSYTVQWVYKNVETNNPNEAFKKFTKLSEGSKIIFKTDEMGSFIGIENTNEIKKLMTSAAGELKKELKGLPGMDKVIDQVVAMYSTKEGIEAGGIKDIQQFHTYHGGKYKLGELIEAQMKVPNMFGGDPFDADMSVYLDEINEDDNNFILRFTQTVNPDQLSAATLKYLTQMAKNMNVPGPKEDDLKGISNETTNGSRMHGSGWLIYSVQTTTVISADQTNIEERVIEIK